MGNKEYFSAGHAIVGKGKKGNKFYPIDCIGDESKALFFSSKGTTFPIGWIININERDDGTYGDFTYVRTYEDNDELVEKYRVESAAIEGRYEQSRYRKRDSKSWNQIENMTLKELKEYTSKSYTRRRELRFYLLQRF